MTELVDHINEQIDACINASPETARLYGLCHLVEDDKGHYPALVAEESQRITPSDDRAITIYHRLLNGNYAPREDLSFGRNPTIQNTQRVRTVVFIELSEDQNKIDHIINALPDHFEVDGYKFANVPKTIDLIRDRAAIWNEEYGEAFKKAYQMRYHVYALEYAIEYIKCQECETSP